MNPDEVKRQKLQAVFDLLELIGSLANTSKKDREKQAKLDRIGQYAYTAAVKTQEIADWQLHATRPNWGGKKP